MAIEAAELKVRLGRSPDALADFEALLGRLDPESWLHREVRRKVEDVFLRTDDLAGLAAYYERWIRRTPDDVEAMARLGRALAGQGRVAEARERLDEAVKLAPSRRELRLALIEQLVRDRKFAEAAGHYEAVDRAGEGFRSRDREIAQATAHQVLDLFEVELVPADAGEVEEDFLQALPGMDHPVDALGSLVEFPAVGGGVGGDPVMESRSLVESASVEGDLGLSNAFGDHRRFVPGGSVEAYREHCGMVDEEAGDTAPGPGVGLEIRKSSLDLDRTLAGDDDPPASEAMLEGFLSRAFLTFKGARAGRAEGIPLVGL